jgi:hypothetical protein
MVFDQFQRVRDTGAVAILDVTADVGPHYSPNDRTHEDGDGSVLVIADPRPNGTALPHRPRLRLLPHSRNVPSRRRNHAAICCPYSRPSRDRASCASRALGLRQAGRHPPMGVRPG